MECGLDNLARTLSLQPRKQWARSVRAQLTTLMAMDPQAPVERTNLRVKLWPCAQVEDLLEYEPLTPLPGVSAVLADQGIGATRTFGKLDQVGDRDAAYDVALTNLAGLPLPRHTRRRVDPREPNSWVEFLDSQDSFGAARVLVLPHLMRRVLRAEIPAHGVLVAVPAKFELWVHVPVDHGVVTTALSMAQVAHRTWHEEPYAISPDVFLVSPDMKARVLIKQQRHGPDVDEHALFALLQALEEQKPQREAS